MNLVIINYDDLHIDKYANLPISFKDDIGNYIVNDLGYNDKEIA